MDFPVGFLDFDWDEGNIFKIQKRFSLEEVELFFIQSLKIKEDTRNNLHEKRFIAVGYSSLKKPMYVCFTFRNIKDETKIRVISCRLMHKKEALNYEIFKKDFKKEVI